MIFNSFSFFLKEMEGNSLGTSSQFDTFGFTATEIARKQAENEQKQRSFPMLKMWFINC